MYARRRPDPAAVARADETDGRDLDVYYGAFRGDQDASLDVPRKLRHGADRPVRLRKVDLHPRAQSHARSHAGRARDRARAARRQRHLRAPTSIPSRSATASAWCSSGPNPFPEIDLRQRRLRTAHSRRAQSRAADGDLRTQPAPGGAVGRSQGSARSLGARPFGRPAAAALHRALLGRRPRSDSDGRAGIGARPDRDQQDRRPDRGCSRKIIPS